MDGCTKFLKLRSRKWRKPRPVIVILSGAGLSAESGIPTYRNAANGWQRSAPLYAEDFKRDPSAVFDNINARIKAYDNAKPNRAHLAIAGFAKKYRMQADILHITQNIDSLCEEAGDTSVFHLHGSFLQSRCTACGAVFPRLRFYELQNVCPACKASGGVVRPNVVFFNEMPLGMNWIESVLKRADVFLAAGTSGTVYPAAGFVHTAAKYGCSDRILVTLDSPSRDNEEGLSYGNVPQIEFTRRIYGSAVSLIPQVLEEIGKEIEKRAATSQS